MCDKRDVNSPRTPFKQAIVLCSDIVTKAYPLISIYVCIQIIFPYAKWATPPDTIQPECVY